MLTLSSLRCLRHQRSSDFFQTSLYCWKSFYYRKRTLKTLVDVPGPKRAPILGNLLLFEPFGTFKFERLNDAVTTLHRQYGPIVRLRLGLDMVLLFDPIDMATVFRNEGKYPTRPPLEALRHIRAQDQDSYKNLGLFTENGESWHHLRQLVNPLLKAGAIEPYLSRHCEVADDFVLHLKTIGESNSGRVTDLLSHLYKYTQEAVGLICFDERLGCFGTNEPSAVEINALVRQTLEAMGKTTLGGPWWKIFPTSSYRALRSTQKELRRITEDLLERAQARLSQESGSQSTPECDQNLFLCSLLSRKDLDPRDLKVVILELFQAGIDATASAIGMTLYYLGQNLDVQEKLISEVDAILPVGTKITSEKLSGLTYARSCIKETLRLAPPSGGSARVLGLTLLLSGYEIPAGTLVIGSHPVMSRSERLFDNPTSYCPERWSRNRSQGNAAAAPPLASLPFGFGRRICPGRHIAEREILLFLVKFFQIFRCAYFGNEVGTVMRLNYLPDRPLDFILIERALASTESK